MNKISIRAVPRKSGNGSFLLLPATPSDRSLLNMFSESIGDRYVRINLTDLSANKTYDQVRTVWALIDILYEIEHGAKPTVRQASLTYAHLIGTYAPLIDDPLDPSKKVRLTLSLMSKYEASVFINSIMSECLERMGKATESSLVFDVQDLFTEFIDWRGRQKKDPVDIDGSGEWLTVDEWCERNNASMASGSKESLEVCHIITKSKRPDLKDCVWNLLRMTHYEHIEIQHRHGWERLLSIYPHLIPRVKAAYDRAGELYPFTVRDKFGEPEDSVVKENLTTDSLADMALGAE